MRSKINISVYKQCLLIHLDPRRSSQSFTFLRPMSTSAIFLMQNTRFKSGVTETHRKEILLQRYPAPTSDNISKRYRNSFVTCLFVFSDWITVLVKQKGLRFERITRWSDSVTFGFKWFTLSVVSYFMMWETSVSSDHWRGHPDYVTKGRLYSFVCCVDSIETEKSPIRRLCWDV